MSVQLHPPEWMVSEEPVPVILNLPLEWVLDGHPWWILAKCWLICPVIPQFLGLVFESRWVPWNPRYQFLSFVPGNFFLGMFIAASATLFGALPPEGLHASRWAAGLILTGAFVVYLALNLFDLASNYTKAQMLSVEKVYHNSLYFWYGYVGATMFAVVIEAEVGWQYRLLVMSPGLVWITLLVVDNFLTPKGVLEQRFKFAHADNLPLWRNGWRVRQRGTHGFV